MLTSSEQLDAPVSGCGATGIPPQYHVGRAHAEQARYRRQCIALLYSPRMIGSALLVLTSGAALLLVAVALGGQ